MGFLLALWIPLLLLPCGPLVAAESLPVVVPPDVLADYRGWLADRDPLTMEGFAGSGARRDVVEVALLQRALVAGGEHRPIGFLPAASYERTLEELRSGNAVLLGTSAWRSDLAALGDAVAISRPLIPEGGSLAGLYVLPGNAQALAVRDAEAVRGLSVVSNPAWTADWTTLQALAPARLERTPTWAAMVRVVAAGGVDGLLAPFQSTDDLSLTAEGVRLVPIPGLAVRLAGSRHLAVSLRHADGAAVAAALDRGLARLEEDGTVARAYRDAGFANPRVADWTRIP